MRPDPDGRADKPLRHEVGLGPAKGSGGIPERTSNPERHEEERVLQRGGRTEGKARLLIRLLSTRDLALKAEGIIFSRVLRRRGHEGGLSNGIGACLPGREPVFLEGSLSSVIGACLSNRSLSYGIGV